MRHFWSLFSLISLNLLFTTVVRSQTGCNIAQINTNMANAGFVPLNVSGYPCALYFYNPNQTNNWNTAQSQATAAGGTLLSVCSLAENNAVWNAAQAAGITGGLWIGYNDLNSEGTWQWTDGSPCNFTNWNSGEPSNTTDACSFTGEDAAVIQMSNGLWNDVYASAGACFGAQSYASIVKVNLCPQASITANTTTLCVGETVALNATTVTGSSPYSYTWFNGATQIGTGATLSFTANNNVTLTVLSTDVNGCTDQENINLTTIACQSSSCNFAAISAAMSNAGFVALPVSQAQFPCARYYYSNATTNVWATAQGWANAVGATLLTVGSLAENNAVWNAAQSLLGNSGGLWIGYNDNATEGQWIWPDGTPTGFTNWNTGEPNNAGCFGSGDGEDAAIIQLNNGRWNDVYDAPQGVCLTPAAYRAIIKVNVCPQTTPAVNISTVCQGNSVQLSSSTLFGSPNYTYTWYNSSSTQIGTGSPLTYSPPSSGTLTVVAADQYGCSDAGTVSVTVNPTPPQPVINTAAAACGAPGTASIVNYNVGNTYTFSPSGPTVSSTGVISGLNIGQNYTVTASVGTCTSPASAGFSVQAPLVAPATPVVVTAPGTCTSNGTASISNFSAGVIYTFTPTGPTVSSGAINGLTVGTNYTVTASNSGGLCTSGASSPFSIGGQSSGPAVPVVSTAPASCSGNGVATITNFVSGQSYVFSPTGPSVSGGTISGLTPGTSYTVLANDGACSSAASPSFNVAAQLAVPAIPLITEVAATCSADGSATITNYNGAETYTFTPAGPTAGAGGTISGMTFGTSYTVSSNNGTCSSSESAPFSTDAQVSEPPAPTVTITQPTCALPTGTILVTTPTGAGYEYSVNGATYQSSPTFTGLTVNTYNVTYEELATGCVSASTSVTLIAPANAPTLTTLTEVDVTCFGENDGTASVQVSGGTGPYTYTWSPSGGTSDQASGLTAGNYIVTVSDDNDCTASTTVTIGSPGAIDVNGSAVNVNCTTSTGGTITLNPNGGTAPYTYNWTPNGETSSGISGLSVGSYTVNVTDDNGCSSSETFTIGTTGSLGVTVTPATSEISLGESVALSASGGSDLSWSPSGSLDCSDCPIVNATPTSTTTYTVTATDENGCTGSASATVNVILNCTDFFVPTVFSPNADGPDENNLLCVYGNCISEFEYSVFNRWGEMVYSSLDPEACWDGSFRGEPLQSGVYTYKVYAILFDGTIINEGGNLTILK
jgi:gliding motility-associated-like protein